MGVVTTDKEKAYQLLGHVQEHNSVWRVWLFRDLPLRLQRRTTHAQVQKGESKMNKSPEELQLVAAALRDRLQPVVDRLATIIAEAYTKGYNRALRDIAKQENDE